MLFKSHRLRASLQWLGLNDVSYFPGNDLKASTGIVSRNLGGRMVEITDLQYGSFNHPYVDQIRLSIPQGNTTEKATPLVPPNGNTNY